MLAVTKAVNRTATIAIMVAAIFAGLLGLLYGIWVIDDAFNTDFWFTAPVATPLELTPVVQGTLGQSEVQYHEVIVYSHETLTSPRMLMAASHALYFLLFVTACIAVTILCVRLLKRRSFTRVARWSMFTIGAIALITSIAAPLLHSFSGQLAARDLGFLTSGGSTSLPLEEDEWIVPHVFSMQDTNWSLVVLGVVLILIAATYLRGERLQRDTEGLI